MSESRLVFRPRREDLLEIEVRSDAVVGQPFITTGLLRHKVIGRLNDGTRVTVEMAEQVLNDRLLMSFIYKNAAGSKEAQAAEDARSPRTLEIYRMAVKFIKETSDQVSEMVSRLADGKCVLCACDLATQPHEFCDVSSVRDKRLKERKTKEHERPN